MLEQLTAPPVELHRKAAIARLRGSLIGPDDRQTCEVITLVDGQADRLEPAQELIRQAAAAVGVPR